MKSISLFLSLLLIANPILCASAIEQAPVKKKPLYKEVLKDTSKVVSALLKSGVGLAFIIAGAIAYTGILAGTLDQQNGFKTIDANIEMKLHRNDGRTDSTRCSFNAWPLICAALAITGTSSFGLAFLSFNSAKNDLQSINESIE